MLSMRAEDDRIRRENTTLRTEDDRIRSENATLRSELSTVKDALLRGREREEKLRMQVDDVDWEYEHKFRAKLLGLQAELSQAKDAHKVNPNNPAHLRCLFLFVSVLE
jgi:uncharacterized protein (DUF3084 family)